MSRSSARAAVACRVRKAISVKCLLGIVSSLLVALVWALPSLLHCCVSVRRCWVASSMLVSKRQLRYHVDHNCQICMFINHNEPWLQYGWTDTCEQVFTLWQAVHSLWCDVNFDNQVTGEHMRDGAQHFTTVRDLDPGCARSFTASVCLCKKTLHMIHIRHSLLCLFLTASGTTESGCIADNVK